MKTSSHLGAPGIPQPWELPCYSVKHHAFPLADAYWRAPAPQSDECRSWLRARGFAIGALLPDGSVAYRLPLTDIHQPTVAPDPDLNDPEQRGAWIAARLLSAAAATQQPLPRPLFMGILNLTTDSFSDGGLLERSKDVLTAALGFKEQGAHYLDLGAESTRPGKQQPVSSAAQLERLVPALELLMPLGVRVSVDTRCAQVAQACCAFGIHMLNDVSALADPGMAAFLATQDCEVVLMHSRGIPADHGKQIGYRFLLGELVDELTARAAYALQSGIQAERIVLDPGIGFGKLSHQSYQIVAQWRALRALGFRLMAGPSRKSFMAEALPGIAAADRDVGTIGAACLCAAQGTDYLRLHDGRYWDAVEVAWASATSVRKNTPLLGRIKPYSEPNAKQAPISEINPSDSGLTTEERLVRREAPRDT